MNVRTFPLRKIISVAASASILATSFVVTIAPTVAVAATNCVLEQGSTTVYPSLLAAQPGYQGAVINPQPAWPTGQKLGCDVTLVANGSGTGKTALRNYYNGVSGSAAIDIAASSAPLSTAEAADLMAFQTGGDAMVIAVKSNNPLSQITKDEVKGIYNGTITTWQQLSQAPAGHSGTIVPRSRITGSGSRDDMKRLFGVDLGVNGTGPSCSAGFTTCEPTVIAATGLPRLTTSQEEGEAVCNNLDQIAYTSLANLAAFGPGGSNCLKALQLSDGGAFVSPSAQTAAVGGSYPAKRQLFLALPKVSEMANKWGTGNGTGWTDNLGLTKAMDLVNYMESSQGQTATGAAGFIQISVPAKQPIPDADIDLNGGVGLTDIGQTTGRWNRTDTIPGSVRADVDNNGGVGLSDIGKITGQWGATGFVAP